MSANEKPDSVGAETGRNFRLIITQSFGLLIVNLKIKVMYFKAFCNSVYFGKPTKTLLIMNFTAIFLLAACLNVSAGSYAQRITLAVKNAPLEQVLKKIKNQSGFHLVYRDEWMSESKLVTVTLKDVSLQDALNECFKDQPFDYSLVEKTIVVREKLLPEKIEKLTTPKVMLIDVTGIVTDDNDTPLQGVNVSVKGSTRGTTTDASGKFLIYLPAKGILVFSFVGYANQEVSISGQTSLNIKLVRENQSLNAVVVTALGIKKDRKALTYSVTQLGGEDLTKAREINLGNALAGRIAGVNAVSTATGPAGSSRVVIRGNGSLNGENQPLYLVNGVPINNANQGSAGTFGGIDRGDGLISINPDDIETISVLKGGTAAALYGSRAANGVILITTKSGRVQKGLGVEYNSTYTWETPIKLTDWQYDYGSGSRGLAPASKSEAIANGRMSWGAKLDGSSVIQPDGTARPYSAQTDNVKNFYNTGKTFSNTLSLSGGNQTANFRFSVSNLDNKGIVPNSSVNRKTFSLSANATMKKVIVFEGNAQYNIENTKNRTFTADFQKNPNSGAQLIATNIDVRTLAPGYDAQGFENLWNDYIYSTNPYFAVNKIQNGDTRRRFIGSFSTRINFTNYLYARGRVGIDYFNINGYNIEPTGLAFNNRGSMTTDQSSNYETNIEGLLGFNKTFSQFSINAIAGGNQMKNKVEGGTLSSGFFNVPFQYFISNGSSQAFTQIFNQMAINSLFASADIGYNNKLFLNLTGRKDWFSTLDIDNNNLFYPSAGLSFVFTDGWGTKPAWLNFGKVRTSWAQVGGGAPSPYGLDLTYTAQAQQYVNGATLMNITNTTIPNKLTPYTSTTLEAGLETRLFNNRVGVDVTLYDRTTTNDIVNASVPFTSGYSSVALNVGEIKNRGIELLLTGSPVKKTDFNWDISFNLAYNDNKVIKIADGLQSIFLPGATTRTQNGGIYHFEGMPFGMIAGNKARTDAKGQVEYNKATGIPLQSALMPLGRGVPPYTAGISNNFIYKNFNVGFLVDGKFGAQVYSATNAYGAQFGLDKRTVENGIRETGIVVSGVDQSGSPYTGNVSAQTYYSTIWATLTDQFITDADFVKLRQVIIGYTLPKSTAAKLHVQSVNLSLVGRNLLLIYNTARNIDPESSYSNGNAQGLENFGLPTARSYGLNLQVKF
ncbi:MAG: SusC/RagA family TonB-linked outer membrane protein [Ferruginibacter sp.]